MAATIQVYRQSDNNFYQISVELYSNVLDVRPDSTKNGDLDYYLVVSTNIRKTDGSYFPSFVVRNLTDVPPGSLINPATSFSQLVNLYVDYFLITSEITQSSSSSSSGSSSSTSSSSSSSSFEYSSESSSTSSSESFTSISSDSSSSSSP